MTKTSVAEVKEYQSEFPAIDWETAESRIKDLKEFLLNAPQEFARSVCSMCWKFTTSIKASP